MRENVKRVICISLFIIFITGCAQAVENSTETPMHMATIVPSSTPSQEPTTTYVYKPPPSQVPATQISSAQGIENSAGDTTIALTQTTPTLTAEHSKFNITVESILYSPKNKYLAVVYQFYYSPKSDESQDTFFSQYQFYVRNLESHGELLISSSNSNGFIDFVPNPIVWNQNEEILYYTYSRSRWDGCRLASESNGTSINAYNISTNDNVELISDYGSWYSLSHSKKNLAVISKNYYGIESSGDLPNLVMINLTNMEMFSQNIYDIGSRAKEKRAIYSNIIWSINEEWLAYTIRTDICWEDTKYIKSSLVLVNSNTLEQKLLFLDEERNLVTIYWNGDDIIALQEPESENIWQYNLNTDELYQVDQ